MIKNRGIFYFVIFFLSFASFPLIFHLATEKKGLNFILKNQNSQKPVKEEEEKNEAVVKDEDLKEKIGQMIIVGFRGTSVSENSAIVKAIQELKLGGVILFDYDVPSNSFPRNILNPEQTKKLITDLQKFSPIPLFIAVDAEGGKINRLKEKYGFLKIHSHEELGKINNPETTKKEILRLSEELKDLGFNINFAPVVDLNINPQNPIIGKLGRSFSSDPEIVFQQAKAFIEAHIQNGIIPVVKHFPGHGSSFSDSHLGMVDVTKTWKEDELIPYRKLEKENLLFGVMIGHIFNKNIDENYPATLSAIFLQGILRKEIGFEGAVVSDDLQMEAIKKYYTLEDGIIKAINAGCDILTFSNNEEKYDENLPYKVFNIIFQATKEEKIPREKILESSERILNLKKEFGIIK
jgi:beta-N-acetylhexosaminidase